jgi:hypothetical protein
VGATYATATLKFNTYIYANSKAPKTLRFVPHDKGFDSSDRWEATIAWTNETLGSGQPKGYVQLNVPVMIPLDVWQIAEGGAHVLASPSKFTISQDSATKEWAPPDIWLYNVE